MQSYGSGGVRPRVADYVERFHLRIKSVDQQVSDIGGCVGSYQLQSDELLLRKEIKVFAHFKAVSLSQCATRWSP